ncbi:uncharacterized protein LOC128738210 [Sabethes cyaneus]|uniref:uncharacterized protein LOC128738210 n=1 Tax=Sabethes cyaneus TaxID=53552 RepID=UPI00237EE0A7|nr:uncharacterized protein LOC128738210 [Sabethes cyaneus]XP_053689150.1 uncharacterized protein LOC128738210 [Sabethes cyaneus]
MKYWKGKILVIVIVCLIGVFGDDTSSESSENITTTQVLAVSRPPLGGFGGIATIRREDLTKEEHVKRIDAIFAASGGDKPNNPKIVSGTEQLVSGSKYVYTISYAANGDCQICEISVWERPWLEQTEPEKAYIYENKCNNLVE